MEWKMSESGFDAGQGEIFHAPEHHSSNIFHALNLPAYDKSKT
jgi:hypothetical protein